MELSCELPKQIKTQNEPNRGEARGFQQEAEENFADREIGAGRTRNLVQYDKYH